MLEQTVDRTISLRERWAAYRREHPQSHARDAADALGVREVELVATCCGGSAVRLDTRFRDIIEALPALGDVKTMTRNATAVIERWGAFERVEIDGAMGQVVGEEIDLRLFLARWGRGFAVSEQGRHGERRSLQFFDAHGDSIHKVYVEDAARLGAYEDLIRRHAADDQAPGERVDPPAPPAPERPDGEIDVEALRAGWDAMQDTHEFFRLLRRFGVARTQALRLGGPDRAYPVAASSLERALTAAAARAVPIMIFVGNRGLIQIHSGVVERVAVTSAWVNVLDPRFNLHVRRADIASAWVVRKPTRDGIVTSLEVFDRGGDNVMLLCCKRKPGMAEDDAWRSVLADLPPAPLQQAMGGDT